MEAYSHVANISFTESNSSNDAHILWAVLDGEDSGILVLDMHMLQVYG